MGCYFRVIFRVFFGDFLGSTISRTPFAKLAVTASVFISSGSCTIRLNDSQALSLQT